MASINGLQTQGLNYSSIDGLTSIYTSNGIIDPSLYVPYTGADKTVDLNGKTLTNIANASALTDAVNLQTMNAKTFIGNISGYKIESLSGNQNEYFTLKTDYGTGVLCSQEDYTSKYLYGQAIRFYTASPSFTFLGSIVPVQFDSSLAINAYTILSLTAPNISINGIITSNASKIKNIAVGTISGDAVAFQQLASYIPYTGATSNVDLNAKQLKNIADGTLNNDAVSLQQMNAKRYDTIQNGANDVYVNCGLSNLTLTAGAIGKINTLSKVNITPSSDAVDVFNVNNNAGASKFYIDTTATNRTYATTALTVRPSTNTTSAFDVKDSSLTSLFTINTTTPTINSLTTLSMNSNKITNLTAGTVSGDAVNYGQLLAIPSLPAGTVQGSYIIYNGGSYINNATNTVNLGVSSGITSTKSTNIGQEAGKTSQGTEAVSVGFQAGITSQGAYSVAVGSNAGADRQLSGSVALGAYAGAYLQGSSIFGSPIINLDSSVLSIGSISSWTNQGSQSGCTTTISAGGTVINSGYIGSLNEVSLPATTTFNCTTGVGILYPNITVASVYRVNASAGFFLQQGTFYANPQSFYFSNGIPYGGGTIYYTSVNYSGTNYDIDSFATTSPVNIGRTNPGAGRISYIIQIMTTSNATQRVQYYVYDVLLGTYTKFGPYSRANGGSLGNTLGTLPLTINQTNASQVYPCQILIYNSTFTPTEMNRLEQFLINKWFRRTTTVDNISIGYNAGASDQAYGGVAIGAYAGGNIQGENAIAIGNRAGVSGQQPNSIILNASGVALNPTKAGCYITGFRTTKGPPDEYNIDGYRGAQYNFTTKELCYNATQIWNVIIIGQATADPSATLPLVYFLPAGMKISPTSAYTCTVVRNSQGDYTLTFPATASPNFGTYTTITVGTNTVAPYTDVYMAKWTSTNTIRITSVLSLVAYRDLIVGNNMSLRIEF